MADTSPNHPTAPQIDHALAFVTNDGYATGFLATFASVLISSNLDQFKIYIGYAIDDPIDEIWPKVVELCERFSFPMERCQRIPIDLEPFKHYKPLSNGLHHSYGRHYLATVIKERTFIYLDSDMLVLEDLSQLIPLFPEEAGCAAVQDRCMLTHVADAYWIDGVAHSANKSPYFNAGLLILNTQQCREMKLLERFHELQPRLSNLTFSDQTYINIIFQDRWVPLPARWNAISVQTNVSPLIIDGEPTAILHFAGDDKPWKTPYFDAPNILWHCIARHIGLPIDPPTNKALKKLMQRYLGINRITLRLKALYYGMRPSKQRKALKARHWLNKDIERPLIEAWLKKHDLPSFTETFPEAHK